MTNFPPFWRLEHLTDAELCDRMQRALRGTRALTAELVAHLGEVEDRRLHLHAACRSMFEYCVTWLGLTEDEACRRIDAARLARRFPALFPLLASGGLSLSAIALLKPHLHEGNCGELLAAVCGKSIQRTREVLAQRFPRPDVAASVRKAPERRSNGWGGVKPPDAGQRETSAAGHDKARWHGTSAPSQPAGAPSKHASAAPTRGPAPAPKGNQSPTATATQASPASSTQRASGAGTGQQTIHASFTGQTPDARPTQQAAADTVAPGEHTATAPRAREADSAGTMTEPETSARVSSQPVLGPNNRYNKPDRRQIEPIATERYIIRFTASGALKRKLELAHELSRHAHPGNDFAPVVERALDLLLHELLKRRFGQTTRHWRDASSQRSDSEDRHATGAANAPVESPEPSDAMANSAGRNDGGADHEGVTGARGDHLSDGATSTRTGRVAAATLGTKVANVAVVDMTKTRSEGSKVAPRNTAGTRPTDFKSGGAPSPDTRTGDTRTGDTRTGDTRTGDTRTGDTQTGDTQTGDTQTGDTQQGKARHASSPLANAESADAQPANAQPPDALSVNARALSVNARALSVNARALSANAQSAAVGAQRTNAAPANAAPAPGHSASAPAQSGPAQSAGVGAEPVSARSATAQSASPRLASARPASENTENVCAKRNACVDDGNPNFHTGQSVHEHASKPKGKTEARRPGHDRAATNSAHPTPLDEGAANTPTTSQDATSQTAARRKRRRVTQRVRAEVVERDGLSCSWTDAHGQRCGAQAWLEYDHRHPVGQAAGGRGDRGGTQCADSVPGDLGVTGSGLCDERGVAAFATSKPKIRLGARDGLDGAAPSAGRRSCADAGGSLGVCRPSGQALDDTLASPADLPALDTLASDDISAADSAAGCSCSEPETRWGLHPIGNRATEAAHRVATGHGTATLDDGQRDDILPQLVAVLITGQARGPRRWASVWERFLTDEGGALGCAEAWGIFDERKRLCVHTSSLLAWPSAPPRCSLRARATRAKT